MQEYSKPACLPITLPSHPHWTISRCPLPTGATLRLQPQPSRGPKRGGRAYSTCTKRTARSSAPRLNLQICGRRHPVPGWELMKRAVTTLGAPFRTSLPSAPQIIVPCRVTAVARSEQLNFKASLGRDVLSLAGVLAELLIRQLPDRMRGAYCIAWDLVSGQDPDWCEPM